MTRLIFGCGYLGRRVAQRWSDIGADVYAVTRNAGRAAEFERNGLRPIVGDITHGETLTHLPTADIVLFAVGFDRSSGLAIGEVYVDGLRNVLDALPPDTGRILYVSSTGVYGQNDGSWVDEDSLCAPQRAGGQACLAAEQLLSDHPRGQGATILRLGGIYGPGRLPREADLRAGQPIPSPADGYLNLIHVDDAARIVDTAATRDGALRIYNVTDGHPVVRRDYFRHLADLLGAPAPKFQPPPQDSSRRARGTTSKRVCSRRMTEELRVQLQYPSCREGLAAILA